MKANANQLGYIREMTAELAEMARTDRFDFLAYLLQMAALEAKSAGKKPKDVQCH
jgi:hypothetical protein